MAEEFYLNNPHPAVELQGQGEDLLLLFRGRLAQFTYLREVGTTWRFQLAHNLSELDVVRDGRFRAFVRAGRLSTDSLRNQFDYLLSRLGPGLYRIETGYLEPTTDYYLPMMDRPDCYPAEAYNLCLLATQAYLNPALVAEYEQLIRAGESPIVVVLTAPDSFTQFILDGHHKFQAYVRRQTHARAVVITKLNAKPIGTPRGLELLAQCPATPAHYRRWYLDTRNG